MSNSDLIVSLVALNGGEIVGKTRLQKMVYLLDLCGMNSGFEFEYHNFGPFSADLASAVDLARVTGKIDVEEKQGYYQMPYAVFSTSKNFDGNLGPLKAKRAKMILDKMKDFNAVELELAATLAFISEQSERGVSSDDLDDAVRQLKPVKASDSRLERAHELLADLGLE